MIPNQVDSQKNEKLNSIIKLMLVVLFFSVCNIFFSFIFSLTLRNQATSYEKFMQATIGGDWRGYYEQFLHTKELNKKGVVFDE